MQTDAMCGHGMIADAIKASLLATDSLLDRTLMDSEHVRILANQRVILAALRLLIERGNP